MNTTEARQAVRERIGDPVPGIYTDAQIDGALRVAFGWAAPRVPWAEVRAVPVVAGALKVPFTEEVRVVRVETPAGEIPPGSAAITRRDRHHALSWIRTLDALRLSRPVRQDEAGTWDVLVLVVAEFPGVPSQAWAVPSGVAAAIIARASASVLRLRIADDLKRGHRTPYTHLRLASEMEREAREILDRATRRPRMLL